MKKDTLFFQSAKVNNRTYIQYYNRLTELAISRFKWNNLPETVDERFVELTLFAQGKSVFFKDDVLGFLCLRVNSEGQYDVYFNPKKRRAYGANGYTLNLDETNSVIIYNNLMRSNSMLDVEMFAERLYNYDRIIDVNVNAQKTPVLISCDDNQKLTMLNAYKQFDGNQPFIFGTKGLDTKGISCLTTGAPFVSDRIYELKSKVWNEALTYLGISNVAINKKERLITDEVIRSQGGVISSRYSALQARQEACKKINSLFGLNISVSFREDLSESTEKEKEETSETKEGVSIE